MPRPIAISLSPNTEPDDVRLAWKTLLSWWSWRESKPVQQAQKQLEHIFPGHQASLKTSGRQALFDLLRAFNISSKDEVIIQAFTCIAVPEPILWCNATPIYADIDPHTLNLTAETIRPKITPNTKAIIVQHTLGRPAPINEIKALAEQHNLILIEDLAHALGGQLNTDEPTQGSSPLPLKGEGQGVRVDSPPYSKGELEGVSKLGTLSHAAILSFGRDKVISSVFGGAVITKSKDLAQKIEAYNQPRQSAPFLWIKQQLLHPVLFSWILPRYFSGSGKLALVALQKAHLLSKAVTFTERQGQKPDFINYQYPGALATLLLNQLQKRNRYTERRQKITARYEQALKGDSSPHFEGRLGGVSNSESDSPAQFVPALEPGPLLRYPLLVENRDDLLQAAKAQRILLGNWYDAPLVPADADVQAFRYTPGSCPHAEAAAKKIINLPTYPTMTDEQVEQVISFIKTEAAVYNPS